MYDNKKIDRDDLIKNIQNMKNTNVFEQNKVVYKLFNADQSKIKYLFEDPKKKPDELLKRQLGYINSILNSFCLKIDVIQKDERKGKIIIHHNTYQLNTILNITEIIYFKVQKGFKLNDDENMFKRLSNNYDELFIQTVKKESCDIKEICEALDYKQDVKEDNEELKVKKNIVLNLMD